MKLNFKKKKMDERELLELYRVEHVCFWAMSIAAFVIFMVQTLVFNDDFYSVFGELVIILIGSIGLTIGTARKGQGQTGWKASVLYSFVTGLVFAVVFAIIRYFTLDYFKTHMGMLVIIAIMMFVQVFFLCLIAYACFNFFANKRKKELEKMYDADEETDDEDLEK